jgi:small GTP-binding protein
MENSNIKSDIQIIKKLEKSLVIQYNYLFKIALIGDSGIGKSSILLRFTEDNFREDTTSTIGVDFKIVSVSLGGGIHAKMQIWDTCGSERFKSLTSSFIKSCPTFLMIFDITKYKSFKNLDSWLEIINENTCPKLICLIGNKTDLESNREVSKSEAMQYAIKHNLKYIETSAKNNDRIEEIFIYVSKTLHDEVNKVGNIRRDSNNTKSNIFEIGGFRAIANVNTETTENENIPQNTKSKCC